MSLRNFIGFAFLFAGCGRLDFSSPDSGTEPGSIGGESAISNSGTGSGSNGGESAISNTSAESGSTSVGPDVSSCAPCTADPPSTAECMGGRCLVTLASGGTGVGLALDNDAVYWTNWDGNIQKIAKTGGEPTTLVSGQFNAWAIAVDSENIYWVNSSKDDTMIGGCEHCMIMQAPIGGGQPIVLASEQSLASSGHIAVDATSVYWTAMVSLDNPLRGNVVKVPIGGGELVTLASDQAGITGIALDAASVYWTTSGSQVHAVMKVAKDGGTPVRLATGSVVTLTGPAIVASNIYVLAGGYMMKIPIAGGDETLIGTCSSNFPPIALAADEASAYWADCGSSSNGNLGKIAVGGGAPIILVSGLSPQTVALDATSVYWNNGHGELMKLSPK